VQEPGDVVGAEREQRRVHRLLRKHAVLSVRDLLIPAQAPCGRVTHELTPETFAVLACAQTVVHPRLRPRFIDALGSCTSAERLCDTAVRHGMLGHVHRIVSSEPDPAVAGDLRVSLAELYRASAERALRQTAQLLRVVELLRERGVEAMPIKGPAWGQRLYGDVTLRNWVDLDLLARYEQMPATREALLEAGYVDSSPFNARILRRETRAEGELPFSRPDGDLLLDIHWQLSSGSGAPGLSANALMSRAEPVELLGREVLTPSPADALLIQCVQGARDRWNRIEAVLAHGCMVRELAGDAWPSVMAAARDARCSRRLTIGVAHACRLLGLETPHVIDEALARDAVSSPLLRSLDPETLQWPVVEDDQPHLSKIMWAAASEDRVGSSVAHLASRVLRPGPEDWTSRPLPPGFTWLHFLRRPFRLLVKWARLLARRARPR
jgi:hypothetical protein